MFILFLLRNVKRIFRINFPQLIMAIFIKSLFLNINVLLLKIISKLCAANLLIKTFNLLFGRSSLVLIDVDFAVDIPLLLLTILFILSWFLFQI